MSNWNDTNNSLAKIFGLPKMTQRAVIVMRGDGPPIIRLTRLLIDIDGDDYRQITERFELRKIACTDKLGDATTEDTK
jgi:hypothetical protein